MTRLLQKLELKKLVLRARDEEDRRIVVCSITAAGITRLARLETMLAPVIERSVKGLTQREKKALLGSLGRIRFNESAE